MPTPGDQLLTVISARKKLGWNAFRDAFDVIHLGALSAGAGVDQPVDLLRLKTFRCFSELGHAEPLSISSTSAIAVAPTALARLPLRGLPSAIFAGARPMDTVAKLRRACSSFGSNASTIVDAQPSKQAYSPAFIGIQATDDATLEAVAQDLGIPYVSSPPAWNLLHTSASVSQYEASLEWNSDREPDWLKKVFDPGSLAFRSRGVPAEVQLSAFTHPVTRRTVHRIRYGDRAAIVDRDWGRWLLLSQLGVYILRYDPALQRIGVPTTVPLPYLLARSLTLFTGRIPDFVRPAGDASAGMDVYCNIPLEAAEYLSAQLGQQLIADPMSAA
jgi:hypothetical protein